MERLRLLLHSARMVGGRRFWLWPLATVAWPLLNMLFLLIGWRPDDFTSVDAQNGLIGIPLVVLGIAFGVQIIAGEIDRRTLEIAFTVPGGTHRVWLFKLAAALLLMLLAEALLAVVTWVFLTEFSWLALYGALQGGLFYLVLSMALSALTKSEATGGLVTGVVLLLNFLLNQAPFSPMWNPEALASQMEPADLLARSVQNRIGILLAIGAITLLGFARAEQRERILGG